MPNKSMKNMSGKLEIFRKMLSGRLLQGRGLALAILGATLFLHSSALLCSTAMALPWDDDMNKQQSFRANEMSRAPAPDTVPLNYTPPQVKSMLEAEEKLANPTAGNVSADSLSRGQRYWETNCKVCHGLDGSGASYLKKFSTFGIPNLLDDAYVNSKDGKVFGVVYFGGSNMPRYGYKFSPEEIWDIVNHLRRLQGKIAE